MPLHPVTLFPFPLYICLFLIACFGLFCYDCNEARRVELSNSRNLKVSYRVEEVNSRIKLSIHVHYLLFIIYLKDSMKSLPFKHPSKIPGSCVMVIERTLGSHKNCSCIFNLGLMMSPHSNAYPKLLGFVQRQ